MVTASLTAVKRTEKGRKTRKQGFIPAIVYGYEVNNIPVKFKKTELVRILNEHGKRARLNLSVNGEEKIGIIKDVDIQPITEEVQHVDIQLVKKDEKVNWEIPIVFLGKERLESKRLTLQVDLDQIKVTGPVHDIPDMIEIDVGSKNVNDIITIKDLNLNSKIKTIKPADTVLGIVKYS